ncbi:hypothetical protein TNCV_759101 [Trichonephila clavipes]|nr:hypothetical protein TNCV_759101 [Trichonephila clavipes]
MNGGFQLASYGAKRKNRNTLMGLKILDSKVGLEQMFQTSTRSGLEFVTFSKIPGMSCSYVRATDIRAIKSSTEGTRPNILCNSMYDLTGQ